MGLFFINESGTIGKIISAGTQTTTGDIYITLLMLFLLVLAIAILFGMSLEWIALFTFPLMLTYTSYYSQFWGPLITIIIYLSIIFTKNFLFK